METSNSSNTYSINQVADAVSVEKKDESYTDKYVKHVIKRKDFENYGNDISINSREDYKNHIVKTLKNPETKGFSASTVGWDMYYNSETNTFICICLNDLYKSTCYPPSQREDYFKTQIDQEVGRGGEPVLKSNGHKGLYPDQYNDKSEEEKKPKLISDIKPVKKKDLERLDLTDEIGSGKTLNTGKDKDTGIER